MEDASGEVVRPRWGTLLALSLAVVFLSVFDVLPLVVLPLAVLAVALPWERRARWIAIGGGLWLAGLLLSGAPLGWFSRGWALLLAGGYLGATLARPQWPVFSRMLIALALALAVSGIGLALTGSWSSFDWRMQEHFRTLSSLTAGDLQARLPDSTWAAEFRKATERMAELQWRLFPAILALQSLAALGLVSWWLGRAQERPAGWFQLGRLREFRFNDQLVWIVIAGLMLILLPLGELATRLGYNALVFMGGLYALRGIGIFLFLAGGSPSIFSVVLAIFAVIFLYPLVLTAVLLVGVGDTWLDVRKRAALASRT